MNSHAPIDIQATKNTGYIGRFAPSPSGHLHFGSMIAALGSYLQAKANKGLWLVRMEDIDPPREMPGAAKHILQTLEQHGLEWDGEVVYQSAQSRHYDRAIDWLKHNNLAYLCQCTRKQTHQNNPYPQVYQRTCRSLGLNKSGCALRFRNDAPVMSFDDKLQGHVQAESGPGFADDFIIHRKDGLYAYQLAVVVDDITQGITEVVRGSDLLYTTLHQMTLYQAFGQPAIDYLHLPVAVTEPGKKLSKQNHAHPVSADKARHTLVDVMRFLALPVFDELALEPIPNILRWALQHWSLDALPQRQEIMFSQEL